MLDVGDLHAVVVRQNAADPDRRGHLVLGNADTLALQFFRLADAALRAHENARVPEEARRESRDRDERRVLTIQRGNIGRERHLRAVELAVAHHAEESLLDRLREIDEVDAFRTNAAVAERARAIVVPAGE